MKKIKYSKRKKIFLGISFILFIGLILSTVIKNAEIKDLLEERNTCLDVYEKTKISISEDLIKFLMIHNKKSYSESKIYTHMSKDLKNDLFGSSYNESKFVKAKRVTILDVQYSIEDKDKLIFYILTKVEVRGKVKELRFMVFAKGDMMYDILVV